MRRAVILFTRVPEAGKTKTRLMPFLTGEQCSRLHENFLLDICGSCRRTDADTLVFFTPEGERAVLERLLGQETSFFPQEGHGLWQRMEHAFCKARSLGYESVVLIGADIPQVTAEILGQAFKNLERCDVVIHPTVDGGYYLIGMKRECRSAWKVEQYGVNTVFDRTVERLEKAGLETVIGPVCRDMDTGEDLLALWQERESMESGSHTVAFLEGELREKLERSSAEGLK